MQSEVAEEKEVEVEGDNRNENICAIFQTVHHLVQYNSTVTKLYYYPHFTDKDIEVW